MQIHIDGSGLLMFTLLLISQLNDECDFESSLALSRKLKRAS